MTIQKRVPGRGNSKFKRLAGGNNRCILEGQKSQESCTAVNEEENTRWAQRGGQGLHHVEMFWYYKLNLWSQNQLKENSRLHLKAFFSTVWNSQPEFERLCRLWHLCSRMLDHTAVSSYLDIPTCPCFPFQGSFCNSWQSSLSPSC